MTKNMLDRKEMRVLEDLLVEHKAEVVAGKWTQVSFAEFATKRMSRPVTAPNVAAASRTMDVPFKQGKSNALRSTQQLRAAVTVLAKELRRLAGELGATTSPEVIALAENGKDE